MSVLSREIICERLSESELNRRLVITPLLDPESQIGPASVDLRLGVNFRVDLRTREPVLDALRTNGRPIDTFFDNTFREFGERFVIYPGQLVLASTFEYLALPTDLYGQVVTRSSMNRLGVSLYSIVQPGYAGTLTIELSNQSSNPVALYPGMRVAQIAFIQLEKPVTQGYVSHAMAKYVADPQPKVSALDEDAELDKLSRF